MPWCGKARLTMIHNRLLWSQLCLLACLCDTYGEGANSAYVPGQVLIMPDTTAHKFSDALRSTSQSPSNLTGYTVFDSLSKAHSLQSIGADRRGTCMVVRDRCRYPGARVVVRTKGGRSHE